MFCPEGYVSLHDSNAEAERTAIEWSLGKGAEAIRYDSQSERSFKDLLWFRAAFQCWNTLVFVNRHLEHFLVASPSGQLMKISRLAYQGGGHLTLAGHDDFPFKAADSCQALCEDSGSFFTFFDERSGIIRKPKKSLLVRPNSAELDPIMNFVGWAICWKPKNYANWKQEFREILKSEPQEPPLSNVPFAVERRAASEIVRLFDANDQVTKAECHNQICSNFGTNSFKRTWDIARSERPGLGVGGRPKSKPQT